MSDKPMLAEIVRADQIKVGDRIIDTEIRVVTETYKSIMLSGWIVFHFDDGEPGAEMRPDHPVARILPGVPLCHECWHGHIKPGFRVVRTDDGGSRIEKYPEG